MLSYTVAIAFALPLFLARSLSVSKKIETKESPVQSKQRVPFLTLFLYIFCSIICLVLLNTSMVKNNILFWKVIFGILYVVLFLLIILISSNGTGEQTAKLNNTDLANTQILYKLIGGSSFIFLAFLRLEALDEILKISGQFGRPSILTYNYLFANGATASVSLDTLILVLSLCLFILLDPAPQLSLFNRLKYFFLTVLFSSAGFSLYLIDREKSIPLVVNKKD